MFIMLLSSILIGVACKENNHFEKALDPLEAGRKYFEGVQQGDFKKAHFYIINDTANETAF